MRVPLSLRLFLVNLLFTIGAGTLAVKMVLSSFERYQESWERQVTSAFTAELYRPLASEVARSLLLAQEAEFPEVRRERRERITAGLRAVLREIPSIRSIVVMDAGLEIEFASDESVAGLVFTRPQDREFLSARTPQRRPAPDAEASGFEDLMIPVFDDRQERAPSPPRRLGAVLIRFVPDASLVARVRGGEMPSIPIREFALPVILVLLAAAAGGLAVSALTALPLRRLDRALAELRKEEDFRGRLDVGKLGLDERWAAAIQAINDMGGRLEVLDARGKERDALLEKLSQSLEEGMIAVGPDGTPEVWNRAAVRLLTGVDGQDVSAGATDPQQSAASRLRTVLAANESLARGDERLPSGASREIEILRADGTRTPIRVTQVPFQAGPGEQGTLLLLRDLVTLRTIESHLADAGRFAVVAHLAAGLAHEIRNPLHAIGINASVVEQYVSEEPSSPRVRAMGESLETIREEALRLGNLLNSYLGLVRPDGATGPVDLREICRRVMQLLAFPARKSHVEIRLTGMEASPPVHGVADRLQQAVLNLALNAIQAMPAGGVLTLDLGVEDGFARVTVSDNGPGVPHGLEALLFEAPLSTKVGGSGLGLPLVRIIVEAHGGRVRYGTSPDQGAAFTILVPTRWRG